jgi:hypothetical protein
MLNETPKTQFIPLFPRNKRLCGFYQVACLNERLAVVESVGCSVIQWVYCRQVNGVNVGGN